MSIPDFTHEDEYVNFEDIYEQMGTLEKTLSEMQDSFTKIETEIDNLSVYWSGDAYEEYYKLAKEVTKFFKPAQDELIKSILFLGSVCGSYQDLSNDAVKKLLDALGYGGEK